MTKKDYVAEAKREYMREWRKNNREKLKAAQKRYWDKKAEQVEAAEKERQAAAGA